MSGNAHQAFDVAFARRQTRERKGRVLVEGDWGRGAVGGPHLVSARQTRREHAWPRTNLLSGLQVLHRLVGGHVADVVCGAKVRDEGDFISETGIRPPQS
jgi:hypothetical protein